MELINGRTLEEVRRYDLFKLVVAAVLLIHWLFFCHGPLPESYGSPPAAPAAFNAPSTSTRPAATAPTASGVVMPPPAQPSQLSVQWRDGRLLLDGIVRDEATRQQLLEAAARVTGSAGKVDDRLRLMPGAPAYGWLAGLGGLLVGFGGATDAGIAVEDQQVVLSGEVADEHERGERIKAVQALFLPGVTIVDRLSLRPAGTATTAVAPAAAAAPDAAPVAAPAPAAPAAPAPAAAAADSGAASGSAAQGAPAAAAAAGGTSGGGSGSTSGNVDAPVPAAKLYFAVSSAQLPAGSRSQLAPLVAYALAHPQSRLRISGFHDHRGPAELNHELAKNRALGVRDALVAAGVPGGRLMLDKPAVTDGGADLREARRVEVSVAP